MSPPLGNDVQVVSLAAIREEIRTASDQVLARAREHCAKNTLQAVTPFQETVRELDQQINGKRGDGHSSGIAWRVETLTGKMSMVEIAQARHAQEMAQDRSKMDEFLEEMRGLTWPGRTPKNGTQVTIGTREGDDSDHAVKRQKGPWLDNTTTRNILILIAAVSGGAGLQFGLKEATSMPEKAVQVQSEAVAEAKADLERRERELARKEAWVERKRAQQGSAGHPATE